MLQYKKRSRFVSFRNEMCGVKYLLKGGTKMKKTDTRPNIIFYFSDQQRWDTLNEDCMPNLTEIAHDGVTFDNSFTCQPVCGPARACLQTGTYATQNGCYWNGIALPEHVKTLADHLNEAGYETAYVGKWHLASDRYPGIGVHCEASAVPKTRQGGYRDYWRAADVLEFTSHGYDGYVFDGDGNQIDFKGYRADCINDFALEYIDQKTSDKPFFLFVSQLEPHHQNDHGCYEGKKEYLAQYKDASIPNDLSILPGDYEKMYPDYLAAIRALDENVARLVRKLKEKGLYENTVLIYTSDHGSHFKTRNMEYKRSCHDSCTHTPLVICGGPFQSGGHDERLVSLIDLPPTILDLAGVDVPPEYMGRSLVAQYAGKEKPRDFVFMQISESQCGRSIRTARYKYAVRAVGSGLTRHSAKVYFEDYLYDLEQDPIEAHNLVRSTAYKKERAHLREMLVREMERAGEERPKILPAVITRKK